jgi:two-component system nitrogen regulation sensor histidine kinase NtrY
VLNEPSDNPPPEANGGQPQGALPPGERRRRLREIAVIGLTATAFAVLAALSIRSPELSSDSQSGNVLFFLLTNLNLILLILLLFLVTRNLVKLIFERRRRILGARLRTRLVLAFVALSLCPTVVLFLVAQGFLGTAIESWFRGQVEQSLSNALQVAHAYYQQLGNDGLRDARAIGREIVARDLLRESRRAELEAFAESKQVELNVAAIEVFVRREAVAIAQSHTVSSFRPPVLPENLRRAQTEGQEFARPQSSRGREVVRCGVPVRGAGGAIEAVVVVDRLVPRTVGRAAAAVARSFQEYRQLKVFRQPMKNSYTLSLLLITLVVIFSATWFGFNLAKGITGPIERLGEGMREVAQGNWSYRAVPIGDEEIATLFTSFNQMTEDLTAIHSALEERRRYIENILANIAAGVVSINARGIVVTVNHAAEGMLGMAADELRGRPWQEAFKRHDLHAIGEVIERAGSAVRERVERQINLSRAARELTVWVTATTLSDEAREPHGIIVFLEDVTHLLRVERMEAWREVARRIAHEIKNPLTPIQLSAQRLRKGYRDAGSGRDRALLDECTRTIIGQVEQLKRLVNEFSTFARLPAAKLAPESLNDIVEEAVVLFREGHPDISFALALDGSVPRLQLDRDAVKRALLNLLDNAVAACHTAASGGWRIDVVTEYDEAVGVVRLEVADNGGGMTPEVKARAFEPYFSTKRDGTGLGLAIVSAIAADHHAYVRIRDNAPSGTRLIIEFPLRRVVAMSAAAGA